MLRRSHTVLPFALAMLCTGGTLHGDEPHLAKSSRQVQGVPNAAVPRLPEPESARVVEALPPAIAGLKPLSQVTIDVRPQQGPLPENVAMELVELHPPPPARCWAGFLYTWRAPAFCHRPLYFEEVNLERYGYSPCAALQPVLSAAHFLGASLALPHQLNVRPPQECIYPLGHGRPGNAVPYRALWPEWNVRAATIEGALATGLVFLIP